MNAILVASAVGYALYLLVNRGAIAWPPRELLASASTLAGCLALVGPPLLWSRGGSGETSLGDLVWMCSGLLIWGLDLVAFAREGPERLAWAAPASPGVLGCVALATLIGGHRVAGARWSWTWTGLTGSLLAALWIGLMLLDLFQVGGTSPGRFGSWGFRPSWLP